MTDEELVLKFRGGDESARDELLTRYQPIVKKKAAQFFLCGGEHDDLVQEGMVGLFSAINSYAAGGAPFGAYAVACIRNAITDAIRKDRGDKQKALNKSVSIEICEEAYPISPEDEIIRLESRGEFLQKISKSLSSLEFKIIVMYLDGTSVSEISSAVDKSQKSVSNALNRAKTKLQKLYTTK